MDEPIDYNSGVVGQPSAAEKQNWMEIENLNEIPPRLQKWNIAAAIFQFIQCAALFYLSSSAETDWYLYSNFPQSFDDRADAPDGFGRPGPKEITGYSVTWYSAVFILLSGLDHLMVSFPGIRGTYEYYIARHQNPFRWFEYTFSASLMRVMIAQLSGVTDVHILFGIFCLAATTMILGACHESVNAKARADGYRQNWFPFLVAWVPHLASWSIIFCYFLVSVSRGDPPGFVWAIVFILFTLDATFAVLFYLQWAKLYGYSDYVKGEIGFIILSFTSKTLLAWLNYGGGSR
jgi:Heliorhodopsin